MKGYNKNRYQYNVQLSTNNKPISFEQMWAMNQTANSPQIISNPLSKAYMNTGGDIGGAMQSLAPLASLTPLGPLGGAAVGAAGSLISMFSKPSQANPTTGFANTNQYGHMATGGSMEQISPNAMEVTGGQGQVDGNDINYKGQQMSLDHGEVVDTNQDIVFSNRLFDPRSGKSFADTVKPLEKLIGKLSKRPSVLNNNTIQALEKQKQVLFQTQEKVAQAMGKRNQDGSTVQPGQEQQMQQPGMAMGGRMKFASAGYLQDPDVTDPVVTNPQYRSSIPLPSRFSPIAYNQVNHNNTPSTTPVVGSSRTRLNKVRSNSAKSSNPVVGADEFSYVNNKTGDYRGAASADYRPSTFYKTADTWLKTIEGEKYQREQRAINPKYKWNPDRVFGADHLSMASRPSFQKMYGQIRDFNPATAPPNFNRDVNPMQYKSPGMNPPNGTIPQLDSKGNFVDYKKPENTYNSDPTKVDPITAQRIVGSDNPVDLKNSTDWMPSKNTTSTLKSNNSNKYGIGDYMQLGAAGIQSIAALLDRPHTPPARIINSPITENRYNPARALQENQFTTNAAVNALGNNYSSAGVSSGLQNLYANKYKADSGIIQNYDQMNQQAKTQYEERLGQRDQFNSQIQTQNDVIKQQDKANYTNGLYNALESVSNVGKGLNQKESSDKALKYLMLNDPEAYKSFMSYMKTKSTTDPATTSSAFGGKIKFRKRR